jgi:hypothetical protein
MKATLLILKVNISNNITHMMLSDAQKLLDPAIHIMMESVHRFEGTVNQVLGDGIRKFTPGAATCSACPHR